LSRYLQGITPSEGVRYLQGITPSEGVRYLQGITPSGGVKVKHHSMYSSRVPFPL